MEHDTARHHQRRTVLLAEHDVLVRMPVAKYLRDCGYNVVEVVSKDEAIEALKNDRVAVSAVVSSPQLAGDGFGISNWVKNNRPDTTVLLTGTPERAVQAVSDLCFDSAGPAQLAPQQLLRLIRRMKATRSSSPHDGRTAV